MFKVPAVRAVVDTGLAVFCFIIGDIQVRLVVGHGTLRRGKLLKICRVYAFVGLPRTFCAYRISVGSLCPRCRYYIIDGIDRSARVTQRWIGRCRCDRCEKARLNFCPACCGSTVG